MGGAPPLRSLDGRHITPLAPTLQHTSPLCTPIGLPGAAAAGGIPLRRARIGAVGSGGRRGMRARAPAQPRCQRGGDLGAIRACRSPTCSDAVRRARWRPRRGAASRPSPPAPTAARPPRAAAPRAPAAAPPPAGSSARPAPRARARRGVSAARASRACAASVSGQRHAVAARALERAHERRQLRERQPPLISPSASAAARRAPPGARPPATPPPAGRGPPLPPPAAPR